ATTPTLPRGEGYGPADIDLTQAGFSASEVTQLLRGKTINGQAYDGRFGEASTSKQQAGVTGQMAPLADVKRDHFVDNNFSVLSSFNRPADLWGRMAAGVDFRGQPIFYKPTFTASGYTNSSQGETLNSPYDLYLTVGSPGQASGSSAPDNPFSVFELE